MSQRLSATEVEDIVFGAYGSVLTALPEGSRLSQERLERISRQRDVRELVELEETLPSFTEYDDPAILLADRVVANLFAKLPLPNSPFSKREKAELRFFEAEEMCRQTNARLRTLDGASSELVYQIDAAQRLIKRILGRFDVNELLVSARHGPGGAIGCGGAFTTPYFKYRVAEPTVTAEAFPYAEALLAYDRKWCAYLLGIHPLDVVGDFSTYPRWSGPELQIAGYNKVTFVPKNAKTDRSIAIEPQFNVYFQLGLGAMIRKRLKRWGIDLDDQTRNQTLARMASIDGKLATIDFSMASDTVSRSLVELLIPREWLEHLDRLRSKFYFHRGVSRPAEKFSSMGNGFTFELESLIFFALATVASGLEERSPDISVYGDDVILPVSSAAPFVSLCEYLGFRVNEQKSFITGLFRESCGEDFIRGTRVRPVFCKELGSVRDIVSLRNRLFELNRSDFPDPRLDRLLRRLIAFFDSRIPRDIRKHLVGPPSETTDGYVFRSRDELLVSESVRWDRHLFAWRYPVIRFAPRRFRRHDGAYALLMHSSLRPRGSAYSAEHARALVSAGSVSTVTARKIGDYVCGTALTWSLG